VDLPIKTSGSFQFAKCLPGIHKATHPTSAQGMLFQDGLTGSAWGDWANYTDSPLRAFEGELGVQAPAPWQQVQQVHGRFQLGIL